ncbi:SAM-dependent methyltransferase [uncultured Algibacter sp.]|uniref:SAM-dependent methyltransferase n=1 Tax=uncultured Algibacter sp. TaxID=298659 RepID=UPI0032173168
MNLNETYWDNRYKNGTNGWDLGEISTPLKTYFDQLEDKNIKILIPGGGNSYEAEYLHHKGFKYIYVVDLSETALMNIKKRAPSFPSKHLIHQDFFSLTIKFDLIIEQTFFCAIAPSLRGQYAIQANKLLNENGKIVGLLFNVPLYENHPPFGGSKTEYLTLFKPLFKIQIIEDCYNSTQSRTGKELFIKLVKK